MVSGEIWRVALDALRANKVKAALTMLGVVIGSACIVLVVTVSLTGKRYIISQIEGVGANLVYAYYVAAGPLQARPIATRSRLPTCSRFASRFPKSSKSPAPPTH